MIVEWGQAGSRESAGCIQRMILAVWPWHICIVQMHHPVTHPRCLFSIRKLLHINEEAVNALCARFNT